jgi:hypothetical protein
MTVILPILLNKKNTLSIQVCLLRLLMMDPILLKHKNHPVHTGVSTKALNDGHSYPLMGGY